MAEMEEDTVKEYIIESTEDYEAAIAESPRFVVFFKAGFDTASEALASKVELELAPKFSGRVGLCVLDLEEDEFCVDLGVSNPGTAFFYRAGKKVGTIDGKASYEAVSAAMAELSQDFESGPAPGLDDRGYIRLEYSKTANGQSVLGGMSGGCCGGGRDYAAVSRLVGYDESQLKSEANLGLGCGTPVEIAKIQPGEVVLDLGSGAGLDCFIAADKLDGTGHVIGVDMTPDMLAKARGLERDRQANKAQAVPGQSSSKPTAVSFRLGEIEYLPVPDASVDVVMSNCVVNLSPDKPQVFRECFRVLKSGGRVAISDVIRTQDELPAHLRTAKALACWVAGAPAEADLASMLAEAGFGQVSLVPKPQSREYIKDWLPGSGCEDFVVSAELTAVKP